MSYQSLPARAMAPRRHQRATNPRSMAAWRSMRPALRIAQEQRTMEDVPMIATQALAGYDGLGFSLKPPKSVRKAFRAVKRVVTLRNVAKVAAVGAAVFAAPVVLPALVHAAGAGGALLARGLRSGASLLARELHRPSASGPGRDPGIGPDEAPSAPTPAPGPAPAPTQPAPAGGGGGSYGGGDVSMPSAQSADMTQPTMAPASADSTAPETAGAGSGANLLPLIIGGVAVLALASRARPRRA
jgi:hypothetical protein